MRTPAVVATAFPPLKCAKMGKVWPIIAKKPMTKGETVLTPKRIGRSVANSPFKKSRRNVIIPALGPIIRNVFVVPVLPLPCSLRFIL